MLKRCTVAVAYGPVNKGSIVERFCRTAKNRDINHLLYFYFTSEAISGILLLH